MTTGSRFPARGLSIKLSTGQSKKQYGRTTAARKSRVTASSMAQYRSMERAA